MNPAFPFNFHPSGHTAQTDTLDHINDMIEQILGTAPGERVNRPNFGSGTAQLVFEPNSVVLATAQQNVIQASLQMWLSDLIRVQSVTAVADDATLSITIVYSVIQTQQMQTLTLPYGGAGSLPGATS